MVMTGLNQKHRGFELALEKTVYHSHILQLVSGFAQAYYTSQPKLQAWQDNNSTSLYYNRKVYLKNYRLGTSPQWVSGIGYRYMGKKYWSASLCLNYFDFIYVEANPNRRTAEVAGKFQTDEKHLAESITAQERLPAYFMLNAHVYKSLRVSKKNYIGCSLSVNNLLNTTSSISGGFEQLRWDAQHPERFANKYAYAHGITYMLLIWGIKLKVHIQ
jgi:outer membrane receptor for Fe3+-dicitrate